MNSGFGPNSSVEGARLVNQDGSTNVTKTGMSPWNHISIYHTLLRMRRPAFFFTIFFFYSVVNFAFAILYMIIGVENLVGVEKQLTFFERFMEAFFFSSQTLTTVGYGRVSPFGFLTNTIASLESLLGILSFALVTGLIYGRFSRPRAYLTFSENVLISPYKDGKALMIRVASYKNNHLTDVEAMITLAMHVEEHKKMVTKFYALPLELAKINSLALSWTIVHPINEESPLYSMTREQIQNTRMEVVLNIKAFDDHFSNICQQRTSFLTDQIIYGARFLPMFERAASGKNTILELDKINRHELVELHELELV